jgi:Zn-dependent protease with chaperone function
VIWDNTLHELTQNQILAILGHEMGHYVLHHIWWSLLFAIIGSFFILGIHAWLVDKASERFKGRLHLLGRGDLAIIPMALLIFQLLVFLQTPIASAISRVEEHQADAFGLRLTHLNKAMAEDFVKFVVNDYADPNPPRFIVFWCYTHPPIRQRLDFVLHYNDGVKTPK